MQVLNKCKLLLLLFYNMHLSPIFAELLIDLWICPYCPTFAHPRTQTPNQLHQVRDFALPLHCCVTALRMCLTHNRCWITVCYWTCAICFAYNTLPSPYKSYFVTQLIYPLLAQVFLRAFHPGQDKCSHRSSEHSSIKQLIMLHGTNFLGADTPSSMFWTK